MTYYYSRFTNPEISIETLKQDIGDWSKYNFGTQESKWRSVVGQTPITSKKTRLTILHIPLRELSPLLGIVEELGEYALARRNYTDSIQDKLALGDAFADMVIFLLDFADRLGISLKNYKPPFTHAAEENDKSQSTIIICIGKLCHLILKRHQGIRSVEKTFDRQIRTVICQILDEAFKNLNQLAWNYYTDDISETNPMRSLLAKQLPLFLPLYFEVGMNGGISFVLATWNEVSKRDWKKFPHNGKTK